MAKIQIYRTEVPHASSSVSGSKCDCPDLQLNGKDVEVVDGVQNINACTQIKTNNSEYSVDKTGTIKLTNLAQTIKVNDKDYDADDDGVIDLGVLGGDANVKIKVNNVEHEAEDGNVDLGNLANRIVIDNNEYYTDADGAIEVNGLDYVRKVDNLDDYLPQEERAVYNRGDDNYYKTEWRQDDVATAFLGEDWRMPTANELEELANLPVSYDSTTMTFTITGNNGNSITLPAAGVRRDSPTYNFVGTALGIWSSTLGAEFGDDVVWGYWIDERTGYTLMDWFNVRYDAYAVLPVTTTTAVGSVDLGLSVRWASALLSKDKTLNNSNPIFAQWGDTEHKEVTSYVDYKFAIADGYGFTEYTQADGRDTLGMTPLWKKVGDEGGQMQTIEVNADVEGLETNSLNNLVVDGKAYLADDIYVRITNTDYRKVIQPATVAGKATRTLNLQQGWSVKQLGNFGKTDYIAILSNVDLQGVAKTTDTAALAATNYNAWLRVGITDANGDVHYGSVIDSYNANLLNANQVQNYVLPYVGGGSGGGSTVIANKEGIYPDECPLLESLTVDGVSYNTHQVKYITLNAAPHTVVYDEELLGFTLNVATDATLNGKTVHVDDYGKLNLPSTASVLIVDGRRYEVNANGIIDVDTDISFFASHSGLNSLGNDTYNHRVSVAQTPTPIAEDFGLNTDNMLVMFLQIAKSQIIPSSGHVTIEEGHYIQPLQYTISIVKEGYFGFSPLYATGNVPIQLDFDNEVKVNFELDFNPCTGAVNGWKFTKIDPSGLVEAFALTEPELQDMTTRPSAGQVLWRYPKLVMKLKDEGRYRVAFSGRTARTKNASALTAEAHNAQAYYKVYESALSTVRRSLTWEADRQQWSTVLTQYRENQHDMIDPWMVNKTIFLTRDGDASFDENGNEYLTLFIKEEYESEYTDLSMAQRTEGGYTAYIYDEYDPSASKRVYHQIFVPDAHVQETESYFNVEVLADETYADADWGSLTMQATEGSGEWKSGSLAVYPTARKIKFNGRIYDVDLSTGIIDLDA